MKMKALLALGLCLALTLPSTAQEKEIKEVDSIYITPFAGAKIILVGKGMDKLLKENNLDVLKNKFIDDFHTSAQDKDFPTTAKNMIYLASADGRRRLKAIPDEAAPIKVEDEVAAFKTNLPPFHYVIYDLTKDYEYHIYVKEPEDLNDLGKLNFSEIVQSGISEAKYSPEKIKSFTTISVTPIDTGFHINRISSNPLDQLVISAYTGAGLINNKLAPTIGFDLDICFANKYGKFKNKVGFNLSSFFFADYENKSFSNFYQLNSYNVHYLTNVSRNKKENWLGFSAGLYSSGRLFGGSQQGSLHKAWQFGFTSQFGSFGIDWNVIKDRNKNGNSAVTFRYYF